MGISGEKPGLLPGHNALNLSRNHAVNLNIRTNGMLKSAKNVAFMRESRSSAVGRDDRWILEKIDPGYPRNRLTLAHGYFVCFFHGLDDRPDNGFSACAFTWGVASFHGHGITKWRKVRAQLTQLQLSSPLTATFWTRRSHRQTCTTLRCVKKCYTTNITCYKLHMLLGMLIIARV